MDNTQTSSSSQEPEKERFSKVRVSGEGGEFIILDDKKYYKHELITAFGGTFNTGLSAPPVRTFGNATALGLMGFSVSCFVLCMYEVQARGVTIPNVVVGTAIFYGGIVEFLVGCWEIARGNTFAGTAFASFGTFWISYGCIFVPWFGIASGYEDPVEFGNAVGFYLSGWSIFIFLCLLVTTRATWPFFGLFFFLLITFILLAINSFEPNIHVQKAGGVVGLITAFFGFYNAFEGIATPENSYIRTRPWFLPGAEH